VSFFEEPRGSNNPSEMPGQLMSEAFEAGPWCRNRSEQTATSNPPPGRLSCPMRAAMMTT
jgi:hypothetical protein